MPIGFFIWIGVLVLVVLVGGVITLFVRRALFGGGRPRSQLGLMEEMRAMRDRGDLSVPEYDRIRKRMAARAAGKDPDLIAPKPLHPGPSGPNHPESSG